MNIILLLIVLLISLTSAHYPETTNDYVSLTVDYDQGPSSSWSPGIISEPHLTPPIFPHKEQLPQRPMQNYKKKPLLPIVPEISTNLAPVEPVISAINVVENVNPKEEDFEKILKPVNFSYDGRRQQYYYEKPIPPRYVRDYKYRFGNGNGVGFGHRYKGGKYLGKGYVGLPQAETMEI